MPESRFYDTITYGLKRRRRVGMADEADSKSVVGNYVRVQVPPPAENPLKIFSEGFLLFLFDFISCKTLFYPVVLFL